MPIIVLHILYTLHLPGYNRPTHYTICTTPQSCQPIDCLHILCSLYLSSYNTHYNLYPHIPPNPPLQSCQPIAMLHITAPIRYSRYRVYVTLERLANLPYSIDAISFKVVCITITVFITVRGSHPTTSISGNNVGKCLLESIFLASCSGIKFKVTLKLLYFR